MAWIGREINRDILVRAQGYRHGHSTPEDFDAWSRDIERMTGVPKDAIR